MYLRLLLGVEANFGWSEIVLFLVAFAAERIYIYIYIYTADFSHGAGFDACVRTSSEVAAEV